MDLIVGTAGHIDHGKTALIKALTGVDADRLPEEKRRGITVDLGFAEMSVGDVHFGFVDVPGHERFVKNMLAGASGIDLVMLVIAADEGVMPQTREHFDICRLLGLKAGIVVLTKVDLVDAETLELAQLDAAELVAGSFLEIAPMLAVSARNGEGIDRLKETLVQASATLPTRNGQFITRLPIDRSFSMKGFGAVVTGTLASGQITEGAEMELLPNGTPVRVRGLQTHGKSVNSITAPQRVAVNLGGIAHSEIRRGDTLCERGVLRTTQSIDSEIEVLANSPRPLRSRQRVRVHLGTVEVLARIQVLNNEREIAAGKTDLVQIRLEKPVVAIPGERFIVRSYSPQVTIAGGTVIDNLAAKHHQRDLGSVRQRLGGLLSATDNPAKLMLLIDMSGTSGTTFIDLQARTGLRRDILTAAINKNIASGSVIDADGRFVTTAEFEKLTSIAHTAIQDFHKREPLAKGITREALRSGVFAYLPGEMFDAAIAALGSAGKVVAANETIRSAAHKTEFSPAEAELSDRILNAYRSFGLEVPKLDEALASAVEGTTFTQRDARSFFQLFLDAGEIVKVSEEFYFAREVVDRLTVMVRQFADSTNDRLVDVAKFKEIAGVSRKYAIPLLEYFDREKVTRRAGDKRCVQKPAR